MSVFFTVFAFFTPFVAVFLAVRAGLRCMNKTKSPRRAFKRHVITLISVFTVMMVFSLGASAAEVNAATEAAANGANQIGMGFLAAALAVGLGGLGGGIAIAGGAPAAIGATSEDPAAFGKAMIFVALGEAVALYGFVIAFVILGKLPTIIL